MLTAVRRCISGLADSTCETEDPTVLWLAQKVIGMVWWDSPAILFSPHQEGALARLLRQPRLQSRQQMPRLAAVQVLLG